LKFAPPYITYGVRKRTLAEAVASALQNEKFFLESIKQFTVLSFQLGKSKLEAWATNAHLIARNGIRWVQMREDSILLYILLDDAVECNPAFEKFRLLCERVSGYYFTERYPSIDIRN